MPEVDNTTANMDALVGLEAYLDSLEGDSNAALDKLAGKTDPVNVRRRLAILINSNRIEDATVETRNQQRSEVWIDLAVFSFAATGADLEAEKYLNWARTLPKATCWQRSAIGYFDGVIQWIFRGRADREKIVPGALTPVEQDLIYRTVEVIEAACAPALAAGRVDTELNLQLLSRLFDALYLLQLRERSHDIAKILETRVPLPFKVAQAILQEIIEPADNIIDRLWNEHGESFRSRFLACLIQARVLKNEELALGKAYELVGLPKSTDEKEDLCQIIYELTRLGDPIALARAEQTATALLGEKSRFLTLIKANDSLRQGDAPAALSVVEQSDLANDPQGMRIKAIATLNIGKPIEALKILQDLGKFVPEPWLFKMISDVARKHNRELDEQEALERLLALAPREKNARKRLSWLYARKSNYEPAARHLEILHQKVPDDEEVTVNLAIVYSFQGQNERALALLADFAADRIESLAILKTRAQILLAQGRSLEAFSILEAVRNNFWEDPHFLVLYLTLGHAADRDAQAHEALRKLLELKERGVVDANLIRGASLDELREFIAGAAKRNETIKKFIIEGKFPWLLGAEMQHEALYWTWTLRTQAVQWLFDDAINRASYCIYATNGFRVLSNLDEPSILTAIKPALKGNKVVVDASALITLHSLGLIHKVAEHFESLLVPASYLPKVISDTRQLFPHQLSRKRAAERIKAAVDRNEIAVDATQVTNKPSCIIDEYDDDSDAAVLPYRLRDVLELLHAKGLLTDAQCNQAKAVAHKKPTAGQKQPPLQLGDTIRIEETTLDTLAGIGLLDVVTKHFSVHLNKKDLDDILSRIHGFQLLETALSKHKDLWDSIQANKCFNFVPVNEAPVISGDEEQDRGLAIAAYLAAKERNLPLLVDDRVCQALLLNDRKEEPVAAFGTDVLVQEMAKLGTLTTDEAADALIKLMSWRYRFIVVSPEILKLFADRYRSHPPGADLRKIALYVHDCMRDEGLFAGLEATNPPVSIAMRLYQTWIQNVAQFIMDVWLDETRDESSAREITSWAISEFLPSPPRMADYRLQSTMASFTPRIAITWALLRSSNGRNLERINQALRAMSSALGLSEKEYFDIVAGVVRGI